MKKLSIATLLTLCVLLCWSCTTTPAPAPGGVASASSADAGPIAPDDDIASTRGTCARACANLAKLGCPEATITDGGLSCQQVCEHAVGLFDMKPGCLVDAKSRAQVIHCGTVKCGITH